MHKMNIIICGKEYKLNTELKPDHMNKIAEILDKKLNDVMNEDKKLTLFDASVLVSLEIINELTEKENGINNIREQIKAYSDDIDKMKQKNKELMNKNSELENKIDRLKSKLEFENLKEKVDTTHKNILK